jgi:ADP-heptose:LPS heptosyltransferase
MSSYVARKDKSHYAYQMKEFSGDVIRNLDMNGLKRHQWDGDTPIPHLFLPSQTFLELSRTLDRLDISQDDRILFLNPDASSPFTCMPVDFQVDLLTNILSHPNLDRVLMNRGFTFQDIEEKIIDQVPESLQRKITILPKNTRIDVYAALTDRSDMFISGDTGPMHIAAAKKIALQTEFRCRNATAVIGIFGATSGQIYGYDSSSPLHLGSPQNAPSKIFESHPSCKNLTCIDKVFKTCPDVLCFDGLSAEPIIEYVHDYFT